MAQGRPWGSQLEARESQNDATWRPQASKMEQKWIPNRLELELRGRRVGEFPFRHFFPQHIVEGLLNFRPRTNCLSYWICLFPTPPCHRKHYYSYTPQKPEKNLENPRYFFLPGICKVFFHFFESFISAKPDFT